jgi:hypothetical protein
VILVSCKINVKLVLRLALYGALTSQLPGLSMPVQLLWGAADAWQLVDYDWRLQRDAIFRRHALQSSLKQVTS